MKLIKVYLKSLKTKLIKEIALKHNYIALISVYDKIRNNFFR